MVRMPTIALLVLALAGCTLSQMEQMSTPKEATEPKHVSWPEGERLARPAANEFAHTKSGTMMATYVTTRWNAKGHERTAGVYLFMKRKGGAMVKGAEGEGGVCFQYDCSLVQKRSGGGWGTAFMDCDEHTLKKVTCSSVSNFSSRHHSR
jgi:hypothetical protein